MAKNKDDGRFDGLVESVKIGVKNVAPRGTDRLAVTFLGPVPDDLVNGLDQHRFVLEGEEQVRSIAGDITGDTIVIHDETVPATFAALKGAAGKNLQFFKLA